MIVSVPIIKAAPLISGPNEYVSFGNLLDFYDVLGRIHWEKEESMVNTVASFSRHLLV